MAILTPAHTARYLEEANNVLRIALIYFTLDALCLEIEVTIMGKLVVFICLLASHFREYIADTAVFDFSRDEPPFVRRLEVDASTAWMFGDFVAVLATLLLADLRTAFEGAALLDLCTRVVLAWDASPKEGICYYRQKECENRGKRRSICMCAMYVPSSATGSRSASVRETGPRAFASLSAGTADPRAALAAKRAARK